jgi:glycosyltransferase involved in cell wall biosynthesis
VTPHPFEATTAPDVSVVIPVRNGSPFIADQLTAIAAATPPNLTIEVVVADNGSTDDTAIVAERFAARLRVRVVDAGGAVGSNYARNRGVHAARAGRILLCDADDEVDQQWLCEMWDAFEAGHELVAGPIDYRRLNPPDVRAWRGAQVASVTRVLGFLLAGHGANLGFTRGVYHAIGGFDEGFVFGGPDIEFCWRAQLAGYMLTEVPSAVVHYRIRASLSDLFAQARLYGAAEAHLYRKFRGAGLRRRRAQTVGREVWWLVSRLPFAGPVGRRGAWLRRLGQQVGRLEGSLRYEVLWW